MIELLKIQLQGFIDGVFVFCWIYWTVLKVMNDINMLIMVDI